MIKLCNCSEFLANLLKKIAPQESFTILTEGVLQVCLIIQAKYLTETVQELKQNPLTLFTSLSCLTALDRRPENDTLELIYTLYSPRFKYFLNLKVRLTLELESLSVATLSSIWKAAEWYEREIYEMFGIDFNGHPNMTNLLLPDDWVGYPLRKDYTPSKEWHGIPIDDDALLD